ncbi:hypothetical protein AWC11_17025 [Mycobacterium interjectum]|nr:hypothetical protein AWC11_17025 [Mycobacterium interjectum]
MLTDITESPNPGAEDYAAPDKFAAIVQRHDYELKNVATQIFKLQKGVNDATQNPIQQIQQFVSDFIILLGGGELAEGAIDFGDLQYILPVLGALFGIGDGPFPLDLFAAAERLFLGYVVPTKQFTDVINNIIGAWMGLFGIDPKFIKDTKALVTAFGQLFGEVGNLLPNLNEFFSALGLAGGSGPAGANLGPLGAVLAPVIKLFSGIDLKNFGNAIEFITAAIDPWIVKLTALINFLNEVLAVLAFPGDVVNDPLPQLIVPFKNLIRFLGNIQFGIESFNPVTAVQSWLGQLLLPLGNLSIVQPNLQINPGFDDSNDLGDLADGKNWTRENLDPPITDGDWVWDLIGRTADGSATVHANGVDHGLLGNVTYVDEGHTFDFDAYVSWTGLTASSGALALHIQTNDGTNVPIASVTSPGATGTWTHLSGSYTVPAGVTSIRLRLFVGSGATVGQVWFDDTNIRRTNLLQKGFIAELEDDLAALFGFFQDLLTAAGAGDVVALGGDIATALSNAGSALTEIGDMLTAAVVSTPSDLGALVKTAQDNALAAGTDLQSILNNTEAGAYDALGTLIQTAANDAGSAVGQVSDMITTAAVADANALGSAVSSSAASLVDAAENAIGGAAAAGTAFGQALAAGFGAIFGAWTGQSTAAAAAVSGGAGVPTSLQDAASQAAAQQAAQAAQTAAIQAQLPHFYGGSGTAGLDAQVAFSGPLPGTFATVSTIAGASAKYNTAAVTDSQTVSGIWSVADQYAKYLFLRGNSTFTTYTYAKIQNNSPFGAANCEIGCVVAGVSHVLSTFALPSSGNLVANAAYTFEATDYVLSVTGPNGLNASCTDSSQVSQVGGSYRYGGFGTDGTGKGATLVTTSGTYTLPAWAVAGSKFDVVAVGGGGASNGISPPQGGHGAFAAATLTLGADFTGNFTITAGSGGVSPEGNGADTTVSATGWAGITAAGGLGGAATPTGYETWNNYLYSSISAGEGGLTTPGHNNGTGGGVWFAGIDTTIPGSMASWAFYDSGPSAGPATALVDTNESTTSATYTDLPTTTDQVTITIGPSGMAIVFLSCFAANNAASQGAYIGFALSGANTQSATDSYSASTSQISGAVNLGGAIELACLLTGLSQGATTVKAKYRASSGNASFQHRRITAIPL